MKAVVLLSGGIDSAAALFWCREKGWDVHALTFDYELEQAPDLGASRKLARAAGVMEHLVVDSPFYKGLKGSPSSGREKIVDPRKGISRAYVPARNIVFFGMAAALAETIGATRVVSGHNRGDAERFPDASREFFETFNLLLRLGLKTGRDRHSIEVVAPFANSSKREVLREAVRLGVPLKDTWSCYNNGAKPCGVCYGCRSRAEAFAGLGVEDPLGVE
ncbi:MAG TPA: 7-cyano-7-deazaguanine synthase QueC [Conexivisphaerales archaeon]|nr:7-cyano-7-deazaguanine synthase QueC [Conexivisphaerales archaeon]